MTNKHTPGEWLNTGEGLITSKHYDICAMLPNECESANARLISAAPCMLQALETTQSEIISALNDPSHIAPDMLRRWLKGVEEAITKARGN